MQQTVSALSSQNIGAGKHDRVRKILLYSCIITVVWGFAAVTLMHFESASIIGMFTDDKNTVAMGCQYMRGYVWDCLFAGIHFSFSGYFYAYGLSAISFLHNAASNVFVRIPFSYFAAKNFKTTLFPMGLASTAGSAFSVIVCFIAYAIVRARQKRELLKK